VQPWLSRWGHVVALLLSSREQFEIEPLSQFIGESRPLPGGVGT
jgi:hypothetical protein